MSCNELLTWVERWSRFYHYSGFGRRAILHGGFLNILQCLFEILQCCASNKLISPALAYHLIPRLTDTLILLSIMSEQVTYELNLVVLSSIHPGIKSIWHLDICL
jgi:uncharacterized membrane protein